MFPAAPLLPHPLSTPPPLLAAPWDEMVKILKQFEFEKLDFHDLFYHARRDTAHTRALETLHGIYSIYIYKYVVHILCRFILC
jgi:hypothetical protein